MRHTRTAPILVVACAAVCAAAATVASSVVARSGRTTCAVFGVETSVAPGVETGAEDAGMEDAVQLPLCTPLGCGNMALTHLLPEITELLPSSRWMAPMQCEHEHTLEHGDAEHAKRCRCVFEGVSLSTLASFFQPDRHWRPDSAAQRRRRRRLVEAGKGGKPALVITGDSTARHLYQIVSNLASLPKPVVTSLERDMREPSFSWTNLSVVRKKVAHVADAPPTSTFLQRGWQIHYASTVLNISAMPKSLCQLSPPHKPLIIVLGWGLHALYLPPARVTSFMWEVGGPHYPRIVEATIRSTLSTAAGCVNRTFVVWRESNVVCDRTNLRPASPYHDALTAMHELRERLNFTSPASTLTRKVVDQLREIQRDATGNLAATVRGVLDCLRVAGSDCLLATFDEFGASRYNMAAHVVLRRVRAWLMVQEPVAHNVSRAILQLPAKFPQNTSDALRQTLHFIDRWIGQPTGWSNELKRLAATRLVGPMATQRSSAYMCASIPNDGRHYPGMEFTQIRALFHAFQSFEAAMHDPPLRVPQSTH